jgi:hypothetical protein
MTSPGVGRRGRYRRKLKLKNPHVIASISIVFDGSDKTISTSKSYTKASVHSPSSSSSSSSSTSSANKKAPIASKTISKSKPILLPKPPQPPHVNYNAEGPPLKLWNIVPRIGVCLVGAPRTLLTRSDQLKGLKYQVCLLKMYVCGSNNVEKLVYCCFLVLLMF